MIDQDKIRAVLHYSGMAKGQRLGQYFVNHYIWTPWPGLFYTTDDAFAMKLIIKYMKDNQYTTLSEMPTVLQED